MILIKPIRILYPILIAAGALLLLGPFNLATANNRGDVWVDSPGHVTDPGHENDPHICGAVVVYGNGLAAPAGSFTVTSWPPTGNKTVSASGVWSYDQAAGGNQVIAKLPSLTVGHYKLDVTQNPGKSKVFWETCQPPSPSPIPT